MLRIGNGGMTITEYTTYFSLWAISKSPLLIGGDVTNMTQETLNIYLNPEVIAINQDPLGAQGKKIHILSPPSANESNAVSVIDCSAWTTLPQNSKWSYNIHDGSIRSNINGQCLTIEKRDSAEKTNIFSSSCIMEYSGSASQKRNQHWKMDSNRQIIVSRRNGKE